VKSKFNDDYRQKIEVRLPDGQTATMWENVPSLIAGWKSGQTQYVGKNQKGFFYPIQSYGEANAAHVEAEPPRPTPQVVSPRYAPNVVSVEPNDETKRQVFEYMKFHTKVYGSIFSEVQKEMQRFGLDVKEEKDIATTVYIQTVRKFNI
jgi:hypothetical protein